MIWEYVSKYHKDAYSHQWIFKFKNGYGASVVQGPYTYGGKEGLFELAVLRGDELDYTTPITDDVIGWLEEDAVNIILTKIKELPEKEEG
jgi:hypothetical protein